jgi:hypothetical protein
MKLATEVDVRVVQLSSLLRELSDPGLDPARRGYKTVYIWRIIVGDREYVPSLPEFKGNHFSGLVSRLRLNGFTSGADEAIRAAVAIENDARRNDYVLQYKELVKNIDTLESFDNRLLRSLSEDKAL